MRPLTPRRVAWICAGLGVVLFAAAVISLRIGAYPISVMDIVKTLFNGAIGHWDGIPSEYRSIVFNIRLPRILLGILVGASLSTAGAGFQALLAKSAGRSVRAGRIERRGAGRDHQLDRCAAHAGRDSAGGFCRGRGHDRSRLFSWPPRRTTR